MRISKGGRRAIAVVLAVLAGAACETAAEGPARPPEPPLRGTDLVVGTSIEDWGLLTVPRSGGVVDLRPVDDPDRVVWTGGTSLPAISEAHVLEEGPLILRGTDGTVYSYRPVSDELLRIERLEGPAEWSTLGRSGALLSADRGSLLEVSSDGAWRYDIDEAVQWAAPVDGGVLLLLASEDPRSPLWLIRQGEDGPAETGSAAVSPPGLVTAWGRRAVFVDGLGTGLRILSVNPPETAGLIPLDGRVVALAPSPSTHDVYVSLDAPPRLVAANRFTLTSRELVRLEKPAEEIRPSLFGGFILVYDGSRIYRVPGNGGAAQPVDGDWGPDLPLGLPGGRVLLPRDGNLVLIDAQATGGRVELTSSADRWWLPTRWNPTRHVVAGRVRTERASDTVAGSEYDTVALAGGPPQGVGESVLDSLQGTPSGSGVPPGFYAIVGSARRPSAIRELVGSLQEAGYPARVQISPDDAGDVWHRGLVGPFASRSGAEAAARQLRRERGLEVWVTEIGESESPGELLR